MSEQCRREGMGGAEQTKYMQSREVNADSSGTRSAQPGSEEKGSLIRKHSTKMDFEEDVKESSGTFRVKRRAKIRVTLQASGGVTKHSPSKIISKKSSDAGPQPSSTVRPSRRETTAFPSASAKNREFYPHFDPRTSQADMAMESNQDTQPTSHDLTRKGDIEGTQGVFSGRADSLAGKRRQDGGIEDLSRQLLNLDVGNGQASPAPIPCKAKMDEAVASYLHNYTEPRVRISILQNSIVILEDQQRNFGDKRYVDQIQVLRLWIRTQESKVATEDREARKGGTGPSSG